MDNKQTTCQICGRPIKASKGIIAHHGYRRPDYGWQTASCMGARHLPYEKSCDAIPSAITYMERYIENTKQSLKNHRENPPESLVIKMYGREDKRCDRPVDFNPEKSYRPYTYESMWHSMEYAMTTSLRSSKLQLEYLKTRLSNWKPETL